MEIFVCQVPDHATSRQLDKIFRGPLSDCGIHVYDLDKMRGKSLAKITVLDAEAGQRFLDLYGVPRFSLPHVRGLKSLICDGKFLHCSRSKFHPTDFAVRSLAYQASQQAAKAVEPATSQNRNVTRFAVSSLQCGTWDYVDSELCFTKHFLVERPGSVHFGLAGAVVLLGGSGNDQIRIDLNYHDAEHIILGTHDDPQVSFSLRRTLRCMRCLAAMCSPQHWSQ